MTTAHCSVNLPSARFGNCGSYTGSLGDFRSHGVFHLEPLVLCVSSPDNLLAVANSTLGLREIKEVVLGGFRKPTYDDRNSVGSLALTEVWHSAYPFSTWFRSPESHSLIMRLVKN